jgi:hypothetical protein
LEFGNFGQSQSEQWGIGKNAFLQRGNLIWLMYLMKKIDGNTKGKDGSITTRTQSQKSWRSKGREHMNLEGNGGKGKVSFDRTFAGMNTYHSLRESEVSPQVSLPESIVPTKEHN